MKTDRYAKAGELIAKWVIFAGILASGISVGRQFGWGVGFLSGLAVLALNGIHNELQRRRGEAA